MAATSSARPSPSPQSYDSFPTSPASTTPVHNFSAIPLLPFLSSHPFPSFLISLPDPAVYPDSTPILPLWSNLAGLIDSSPMGASSSVPSILEDTLLSRMDQYSVATLKGLVSRVARKLASEAGQPGPSASLAFVGRGGSGAFSKRLGNKKRTRSEMDLEGVNGQDVIFIRSMDISPEDAFHPTLIPVSPSFSTPRSPTSTSSSSPSSIETLLVLQLSPLNQPSTSSKHRPIVEGTRTTFLPQSAFWSSSPREVDEQGYELSRHCEDNAPDKEMYSASPGRDVGLGVHFGEEHEGGTPTLEISTNVGQGKSFESDVSESGVTERDVQLEEDTPMETDPSLPQVMTRSSFGTRELLETFDWASTSLGPKSEWPSSLKTAISIVMSTGHESSLWWGPEFVLIYNDSYAEMSLRKHPWLYGKTGAEGWGEIWAGLEPLARQVMAGGRIHKTDDLLFFQRDVTKAPEETYHTWSFIPVQIEDGSYGGLLNTSFETTSKVLAERRLEVLRDMASTCFSAKSQEEFFDAVISSLKENRHDIPFALLYKSDVSPVAPTPVITTGPKPESKVKVALTLAGTIGIPEGHASAPTHLTLTVDLNHRSGSIADSFVQTSVRHLKSPSVEPPFNLDHRNSFGADSSVSGESGSNVTVTSLDGKKACPWPIAESVSSRKSIYMEDCRSLVEGFESRSWGEEMPESALIIPIADTDDPSCTKQAVLIVGLNTRRPFDKEYQSWLRLLRLQLSSGLTGVLSIETQIQRADELAKLDRAKTTFFSNVSHELRTPLTLIQGPVADLALAEKDETKKRMLTLATRNIQRLGRIINLLMDVSRVEAGRMQGSFSPRQLGSFTAELASLFRSAIEKGKIRYTVECDVNDPRMVYIDPDLWEKIVFNIIGNAFKYCLKGSIRVFLRYREDEVEFGVQDTGVGIPKEDIPKVVERFHRVANIGRSYEGTGIGLSLTSELIKMHGGTLSIESTTSEDSPTGSHGSTFIARIPLGTAHLPKDRIEETADPSASQVRPYSQGIIAEAENWFSSEGTLTQSDSSSQSDSGGSTENSSRIDPATLFWSKADTILIVDDNVDMRWYLTAILSPYCTVIEAPDGKAAFDIAVEHPPNLIVSDVMMPIMDGHQLLAALRSYDSEVSLVPLIMITARAGEDEKVNGLLLGAEDYLPKPFSSKELVARCHLQMQMGKRRIELERKFAARTLEIQMRAEEAEEKRKEAEEQRRQQELLVDVTSHEIRNPVSAILQNSGLCKDNLTVLHALLNRALKNGTGFFPTPAIIEELVEDLESLDSIIAMGQSQERIANDILSLARIQLHTLEIFPIEMNLIAESKRILNVFASECRMKNIKLSLKFGDSLLGLDQIGLSTIKVDSVRLGQVLINLLSNAIRFTAPSPVREIQVYVEIRKDPPLDDSCLPPPPIARPVSSPRPTDEDIFIYGSVSDSGPGLSPDELSQLFQRFKQANAKTHAVFGGSGLGLYVCRRLCELMDGKIEVASEQGHGSTFRFFVSASLQKFSGDGILPSPLDLHARESFLEQEKRKTDEASRDHHIAKLRTDDSLRVLIVEDNLINQKVLKRQLVKAGFNPDVASDGSQALDLIRLGAEKGERYGVILMDLEMPVMDGLTAIRTIREMEARGETTVRQTVFALTGNARQFQIDQALASGMDDVILKPYKIDDLLLKLRSLDL